MFYLPEQDHLFVHIPRTGGKSYKVFLENYGTNTDIEIFDKHSPVSTAMHYLDNPDSLFKCSIVRNPYDREVSLWRMALAGTLSGSDMTFETWVNWRYEGRPKDISNLLTYLDPVSVTSLWGLNKCPQVFYLVDRNGKIRMDYIGTFENYEDIYTLTRNRFFNIYGYVKHVAMQNETPHLRELNKGLVNWRKMYEMSNNTQKTLDLVYNFHYWDFECFGYIRDWQLEDSSPSQFVGEFGKPTSDVYEDMMRQFPLKKFYGARGIPLMHDALSYSYMPDGSNRNVYLRNTSKIKVNDVVMRDES